jgi:N6-adenosine-specific RNA methylase IME4
MSGGFIVPNARLDPKLAEAEREHELACAGMRGTLDHVINSGRALAAIRDELPYGQWLPYLRASTRKIPDRTARLYVQLYDHHEEWQRVANPPDSVRSAIKFITDKNKEARNAEKRERRAEREQELGEDADYKNSWRLDHKLYSIIVSDPPWEWVTYSEKGQLSSSPGNHYLTVKRGSKFDFEDLCALDIPAAKDCVLFGWATVPCNPEAFQCYAAWGWKDCYKSKIYWIKPTGGQGYWSQNRVEELLIFRRGNKVPAPTFGSEGFPQVIEAPRGEHSEKPEVFFEHIDRLYPNLPKLEMFARRWSRPGWEFHGNEVPKGIAIPIGQRVITGDNIAPVDPKIAQDVKAVVDDLNMDPARKEFLEAAAFRKGEKR